MLTDRQTDKHANRQTDRQTNMLTDRQTDKHANRQTDRQTNKRTVKHDLFGRCNNGCKLITGRLF